MLGRPGDPSIFWRCKGEMRSGLTAAIEKRAAVIFDEARYRVQAFEKSPDNGWTIQKQESVREIFIREQTAKRRRA